MDILTKIKIDHFHIESLLQQIITEVKAGNRTNILLQDLLEEVKEHLQAERVCLAEMFLEEEKQAHHAVCQNDKETIFKLLSDKLYQEMDKISGNVDKISGNKDLEDKLKMLEILLQEHSSTIEKAILLLSQECINDQQSEELSLKFEQEKLKTLMSSITYA